MELFWYVLTVTYLQWDECFFEQNDRVAMGSSLSPVVTNFYMEKFEEMVLQSTPLKPACWLRYIDDTFVIWSCGKEKLLRFLDHLNSIHPRIQFTMEIERHGQFAFLDILITKKNDGGLGLQVYHKLTHVDRYFTRNQ